jgi:predicted RNase H-like nuclease
VKKRKFIAGIDGCKGGWLCVLKGIWGNEWRARMFRTIFDLQDIMDEVLLIAIDMPIGLPSLKSNGERTCDRLARKLLQKRACCVFPVPSREEIAKGSHRLPKQTLNLIPKLKELDEFMTPSRQIWIKETHPELGFFEANQSRPLNSKKTKEGLMERTKALGLIFGPDWHRFVQEALKGFKRKEGLVEDMLDASIALWTASRILKGTASRLPPRPVRDEKGLFMEIWF